MKKPLIAAALVAVAAPLLAVQADRPRPAPGPRPGPEQAMTRVGVTALVQTHFRLVDTDDDGAVTRAECDAYRARQRAEEEARRSQRRSAEFTALDSNRDGQLSKAEFLARPDRGPGDPGGGHGYDRKGPASPGRDGPGGPDRGGPAGRGPDMAPAGPGFMRGWGGPRGDERANRFFTRLDANSDGKVTLAEATARPLALFDRADANHDGTVTPAEHRAAREAMRPDRMGERMDRPD